MTAPVTRTLYASDTLMVRAHLGRNTAGPCFVVFDPMSDDRSLDRFGFGEAFLGAHGFDAVHVLSASNGWYQDAGLPDALRAVRDVTRHYGRVVAYGSSMGGYAAFRFSDRVGADMVIAISPQYSMLSGFAGFENRWLGLQRSVTWLHEKPGDALPPVQEGVVIFDDTGLDRHHAEAILRDLPGVAAVPVSYAGHPAGAMLAELGLLSAFVIDAACGRLDLPAVAVALRQERYRSGQYLFTLARRQPPWRLRTKRRLALRATAANPDEPIYLSYAALLEDHAGQAEAALAMHERARGMGQRGQVDLRLAAAHMRAGRVEAAQAAVERAVTVIPTEVLIVDFRAVAALRDTPLVALRTVADSLYLGQRLSRLAQLWRDLSRNRAFRALPGTHIAGRLAAALIRRTMTDPAFRLREIAIADGGEGYRAARPAAPPAAIPPPRSSQ